MGNDNDGVVVIGTRVDTKQLKRDLKEVEQELRGVEKEGLSLQTQKSQEEEDLKNIQDFLNCYEKLTEELIEDASSEEEINRIRQESSGIIEMGNMAIERTKENIEQLNKKIEENIDKIKELKKNINETNNEIKKSEVSDFIRNDNEKKAEALGKVFKTIGTNIVSKTTGISQGIQKVLMPLVSGKILAAVMGIFSVILLVVKVVTNAFKNLTTNNEKMKEQWTEIKNTVSNMMTQVGNALAQLLQPLIQWILDAIQKIVQYVGYLLKAWFNIDIFAKSMNKSLDKSNKSASKLRKTIAGFDEMNILNDNTAGAGGIADNINDNLLKPLAEAEAPDWMKVLGFMGLKSTLERIAWLWKITLSDKFQGWIDWLANKSDWVHQHLGDTIGAIYDEFVRVLQDIKDYFDRTFNRIIEIYNIFSGFIKKVFAGDWEGAWQDIKNVFKIIWAEIIDTLETFFKVIIPEKFQGFATKIGDLLWTALKWVLNKIMQRTEDIINKPIKAYNFLSDAIKSLLGTDIGKLELIKLPRLAKGGIINMPGKGVPVGSAIAGESGREAVLPLTDSQQMELLGETIGRYITINANIVNTMNGRVISRELQKVQNDSNFAYNR